MLCKVARIEKSLKVGEVALGCFMDIEGAFGKTGFGVISRALLEKGVAPVVVRNWVDIRTFF